MIPAWVRNLTQSKRGIAMKPHYLIATVAITLFAFLLITHQRSGADTEPPKDVYFTGRYIAVNYHDSGSTVLENIKLKVLGGRTFIVGKISPVNNLWKSVAGSPMWIPVDSVTQIAEFKGLEDVNAVIETGEKFRQSQNMSKRILRIRLTHYRNTPEFDGCGVDA
jgi:hypothetical protein